MTVEFFFGLLVNVAVWCVPLALGLAGWSMWTSWEDLRFSYLTENHPIRRDIATDNLWRDAMMTLKIVALAVAIEGMGGATGPVLWFLGLVLIVVSADRIRLFSSRRRIMTRMVNAETIERQP